MLPGKIFAADVAGDIDVVVAPISDSEGIHLSRKSSSIEFQFIVTGMDGVVAFD
jgi:hypothetical protein